MSLEATAFERGVAVRTVRTPMSRAAASGRHRFASNPQHYGMAVAVNGSESKWAQNLVVARM